MNPIKHILIKSVIFFIISSICSGNDKITYAESTDKTSAKKNLNTIFVDNISGADTNDGKTDLTPVATLKKGVSLLKQSGTLVLKNTSKPYRESFFLEKLGGTPSSPLVIEGNGAVLSGALSIPVNLWQESRKGLFFFPSEKWGALQPYLINNGTRLSSSKDLISLKPGEHFWAKEGVYFIPESGKRLSDYNIEGTLLESGFQVLNAEYITCRNLICEYFANDGFNIHGNCQGLLFENIESRHNGDDGFSIHEDVGATIFNAFFHDNDYGIQDINASRSSYHGIISENNRVYGVHFAGGNRSLIDSVVRNNSIHQIVVSGNTASQLGFNKDNPLCIGSVYLKNVVSCGGDAALSVERKGCVVANNSVFTMSRIGINVDSNSKCHLISSIVSDCKDYEVVSINPDTALEYCIFYPGKFIWGKEKNIYVPEKWEEFCKYSGQNRFSKIINPSFTEGNTFVVKQEIVLGDNNRKFSPGLTKAAYSFIPFYK